MAYLAPIHRPSSVRYALKLNFLDADEECLVIAKADRLEIWVKTSEGLAMAHSKAIYGRISILQKIRRPCNSPTDHLLIGTERLQYFTAAWNPESRQLDTVQTFVDVSQKHMRDSKSLDRCLVDSTGKHIVMELFEGVLNLIKVLKPKKGFTAYLDHPEQVRIKELFIRSSTFLYTESRRPKLALLYEAGVGSDKVRLATYRVTDEKGRYSQFDASKDRENELNDLDPGARMLIPVQKSELGEKRYIYRNHSSAKAQLGGLIVVGETRMLYLDDESKATVEYALDEASIFQAWERYDNLRYLLADDYGWLHLLSLLVEGAVVTGMEVEKLGGISTATALVYLGEDLLYVASHVGDSQLIKLDLTRSTCEVLQTMPNIAPILDFTVMDMGNRDGSTQSNEYSTGQARIVTGSGGYQSGSLRSVRSGVGLEDIGLLGEMEHVSGLFSLRTNNSNHVDTLVISFPTETRIFRFDPEGEVEEMEEFLGMSFLEQTLFAANFSGDRILQVTSMKVLLLDAVSGMTLASWQPINNKSITAASANHGYVLLSIDGRSLVNLDVQKDLSEIARQNLEGDQVSCVHISDQLAIGIVGFWQAGSISILNLATLEVIHGETLRTPDSAAVPRSIVLTQIVPAAQAGPTLLVAMSDGIVFTFSIDSDTFKLSGKKSIILGNQQANFQLIPRDDGLSNIFATCEHSSLIYGSEGRIVYSAVTAENAICVCPFDSKAYPDAIVIATSEDVRISQIDTQRRTHVRSIPIGECVRRIAYSANERVFALGCVRRDLIKGREMVNSSFRLVDEVAFGELGKPFIFDTVNGNEIIECVVRAELPNAYGQPAERFIVGTSYLDENPKRPSNGRIRVFAVNKDRNLYEIINHGLKGACRVLAVLDGNIVAALVKTVIIYRYRESTTISGSLEKIASYRTSTCPTDLAVTGNIIAVGDLMKSISLVEYTPGTDGVQGELIEVARHFQSCWVTALSHIEGDSYLECDDDFNLMVLRRNVIGITSEDRQKLDVTSEMNLGEQVNRVRKIDVETTANAIVIPRAFLATVEGSIYLFGTIIQSAQDLLMRLQSRIVDIVQSPGGLPFNKYRSFKSSERETEEPFRFIDGELIEKFLDISEELQEEICRGLGPSVEDMRNMVEELKRLH